MNNHRRPEEINDRLRAGGNERSEVRPPGVEVDENGLILPKKLYNPCLNSRETKDLTHQIKWNAKT